MNARAHSLSRPLTCRPHLTTKQGRRMLATRSVAAGTELFSEDPILFVETQMRDAASVTRAAFAAFVAFRFLAGGFLAGAFALVSNPFFALVDETSFEGDSLRGLGLVRLGVAGLLVGAGSKLGAGCTCGNGIQGLACLSKASFGFVLVFMATGALAAYLVGNDFAPAASAPFSWPLARAVASIAVAQFFMRTNKKVSNVLGGCGFAASLVLAAMVKPSKIEGFLHVSAARGWDPSLAFVMGIQAAI